MKSLIFDLDDTLVQEKETVSSAFLEACRLAVNRYGIPVDELHTTVRETCRSIWQNSPAREYCVRIGISSWEGLWGSFEGPDENLRILKEWAPAYRHESWHKSLLQHNIDDKKLADEMADTFISARRKYHKVFDDSITALTTFKSNYKLGLLTNGAPDIQWDKILGAGIENYFDSIIVSGDIGIGKPDPRIFEEMLARLESTRDNTVMIGDSLRSDIGGARAAGIKAVWINRYNLINDGSIVPEMEIKNLGQLESILRLLAVSPTNPKI